MPKGDEITTKFRVDISDLKKGISDANQQIKLANAEFKAATAGMDDWAKSADGIKAKLNQLESVLAAQKTKLEAYTTQLERQQKAYDENGKKAEELKAKLADLAANGISKTSEEYKTYENALAACESEQEKNKKAVDDLKVTILNQQAAVNKTEAEIRNYNGTLANLEDGAEGAAKEEKGLNDATSESGEAAGRASDGFTVFKGVLADLVASGIKSAINGLKKLSKTAVDSWKSFDKGRDTIIKLTGATGDEAKDLQKTFSSVSKRIVADSGDIGNAIGEVSTRFGVQGDDLEELSVLYLKFAEITGTDVLGAVDDTQKAMSAFGLGADQAAGFLDALAATSQATGVSTSSLTSGLISNATAFQEMGLSVEQSVAFMGMLEKSGANSETVLNGMRKALKNSASEGVSLNEALTGLQASIEGNSEGMDGLVAAYDLFGKSGDQIYGAIANGTISFTELAEASDSAAGTVENTFSATKDASDAFQLSLQGLKTSFAEAVDDFLTKNGPELESLLEQISEKALPVILEIVQGIASGIGWIMENIDWIAPLAGILAGIATAIGLVSAAQTALNVVMNANPIILVITAIGTLTAAFVALWNTSEEFRQFWINLWDGVKKVASDVWTEITGFFIDAWNAIKAVWDGVGDFFVGIWDGIKNVFKSIGSWFSIKFSNAWEGIKSAWSSVTGWFGDLWDGIKDVFSSVGSWFSDIFSSAWEGIKTAWKSVTGWFSDLWEGIKSIFEPVGEWFGEVFQGAVDIIKAPINWIIDGMNLLIKGLNKISFEIPDWVPFVGGKKFGIDIPLIPNLEKGGILAKGQTGFLEGNGAEAVVPLERNKYWIREVVSEMMAQMRQADAAGSLPGLGTTQDYNFTQIINAPEAPSRIEIYRQTRNLLAYARAAGGV